MNKIWIVTEIAESGSCEDSDGITVEKIVGVYVSEELANDVKKEFDSNRPDGVIEYEVDGHVVKEKR